MIVANIAATMGASKDMTTTTKEQIMEIEEKIIGSNKHLPEFLGLINKKARLLFRTNPELSKQLSMEAMSLAQTWKNDKEMVLALTSLGGAQLSLGDYELSSYNCKKAVDLSKKINDYKGQLFARNILSIALNKMNRPIESIKNLLDVYKLATEIKHQRYIFNSLNNIAYVFSSLNQPEHALRFFLLLEKYPEDTDDYTSRCVIYQNIAEAYLDLSRPEDAIKYLRKSEKFVKYSSLSAIIQLEIYVRYYEQSFRLDKAISYAELAVKKYREMGNKVSLARSELYLAKLYLRMERKKDANSNLEFIVESCKDTDEKEIWLSAVKLLAEIQLSYGEIEQARLLLEAALSLDSNSVDLSDIFENYSQLYEKTGNYEKALSYYKKYFKAKIKAIEKNAKFSIDVLSLTDEIETYLNQEV